MTTEQAIAIFKERLTIAETYADCDLGGYDEAMRMAIKALCLDTNHKGHWINEKCSICGCSMPYYPQMTQGDYEVFGMFETDYCPNCGAKLKKARCEK